MRVEGDGHIVGPVVAGWEVECRGGRGAREDGPDREVAARRLGGRRKDARDRHGAGRDAAPGSDLEATRHAWIEDAAQAVSRASIEDARRCQRVEGGGRVSELRRGRRVDLGRGQVLIGRSAVAADDENAAVAQRCGGMVSAPGRERPGRRPPAGRRVIEIRSRECLARIAGVAAGGNDSAVGQNGHCKTGPRRWHGTGQRPVPGLRVVDLGGVERRPVRIDAAGDEDSPVHEQDGGVVEPDLLHRFAGDPAGPALVDLNGRERRTGRERPVVAAGDQDPAVAQCRCRECVTAAG